MSISYFNCETCNVEMNDCYCDFEWFHCSGCDAAYCVNCVTGKWTTCECSGQDYCEGCIKKGDVCACGVFGCWGCQGKSENHIPGCPAYGSEPMVETNTSDLERLIEVVLKTFGHVSKAETYGQNNSVLNVLDCVLSLNRHYNAFVVPRITAFASKNPDIIELSQLLKLIKSYPSPAEFGIKELNYNHGERVCTIAGVARYLLVEQQNFAGNTEMERLNLWANSCLASDFAFAGVRGFGLAGFQYLRMLFGAQTTKPDVHIINFVSEAIGKNVDAETALSLLELAAKQTELPLRELDGAIWDSRAGK